MPAGSAAQRGMHRSGGAAGRARQGTRGRPPRV